MARIQLDGVGLEYELVGPSDGPPVVLTPGGRYSKDIPGIPQLAQLLAERGLRVLTWDRPNCGKSDLHFEGASESGMQAQFLVKLIHALDIGPATLVAGSAGARISLLAAHEDPDAVAKMMLCWISGGLVSMMRLGSYYCCEPAEVAALQGMAAVAEMPIWQQQIEDNPRNRDYMLGYEPEQFIAVMERWAWGFVPATDTPVGNWTDADFSRLTMPVAILRGSPRDLYHPGQVCEQVAERLPNAQLVDPPWDIDIFAERMRDGKGLFSDFPMLADQIAQFVGS
ncbi:MAG: alpha/beta hydrolase [Novosphingobium sp.]|nr:alpha/beta hydrolase [Novosphingobium sp.]